jgi:hypothetical protein
MLGQQDPTLPLTVFPAPPPPDDPVLAPPVLEFNDPLAPPMPLPGQQVKYLPLFPPEPAVAVTENTKLEFPTVPYPPLTAVFPATPPSPTVTLYVVPITGVKVPT